MSLHRVTAALALSVLAGCTLLTGASDLTTDPSVGKVDDKSSDAAPGVGTEGGPGRRDGAADDELRRDGGGEDVVVAPAGSLNADLRAITFEGGSLTGMGGGDTATGSAVCSKAAPLRGTYSMITTFAPSYVEASFAPSSELFVSFVFTVATFPQNQGGGGGSSGVTVARLSFMGSASTLEVTAGVVSGIRLILPNVIVGLGPAAAGVVYRVGLHLTTDASKAGSSVVGYTAVGATTPFGASGGQAAVVSLGAANRVAFGVLGVDDATASFDQLLLGTKVMPGP